MVLVLLCLCSSREENVDWLMNHISKMDKELGSFE